MLASVRWVRTNNVILDIGKSVSLTFIVEFRAPLMCDKFSLVRKVLYPQKGVVTDVLADNGGRIQRRKVAYTNRAGRIEPRLWVQDNRTLIGIIAALCGCRKNGNENVAFAAALEHKGFDFNTLAARKDITDGNGTNVSHRHRIVECLQFSIQVNDKIAILQTVFPYDGTVFRRTSVKTKDILRTNVVLYHDPFGRILHFDKRILVKVTCNQKNISVNCINH